uniref:NIF system FeS cluster assembly NifU N-terminal domain-containing protein n=1 Tax=Terrapene triunguis TaxID=2587831 RepID=A0A674JSU7_9SAUR
MLVIDVMLDLIGNPRNMVGAPACGDGMKLQAEVDKNGKKFDTRFKTFGKTVGKDLTIRNFDIAKELCSPPVKLLCSMLAKDEIKVALTDYKLK